MMLELIRDDINTVSKNYGTHTFLQLAYSDKLLNIFSQSDKEKREAQYKAAKWMHTVGEDLGACRRKTMAFIFNIDLNETGAHHWVAVILKIENQRILYSDSLGKDPPTSLIALLNCWIL